jgi:hypothetical protein
MRKYSKNSLPGHEHNALGDVARHFHPVNGAQRDGDEVLDEVGGGEGMRRKAAPVVQLLARLEHLRSVVGKCVQPQGPVFLMFFTRNTNVVSDDMNFVSDDMNFVLDDMTFVLDDMNFVSDDMNFVLDDMNLVLDDMNLVSDDMNLVADDMNFVLSDQILMFRVNGR